MNAAVAYAVGLYEGEGSVSVVGRGVIFMGATMTDREPLERLVVAWGGRIHGPYTYRKHPERKPYYCWRITGWDRVEEIYEQIVEMLSPRRRSQFVVALAKGTPERRDPRPYNSRKTHCRNGHPYSEENTYRWRGGHRECRTCRRERKRARAGAE